MREIRQAQNITLEQLSEKSGVQIATLSRIENLRMVGTLDSHIAIAKALSVDVTQLYADIVTKDNRVEIKTEKADKDVFVHSDKSSFEILTSKALSKKMMPTMIKIEPKGATNKEQNNYGSEKFIYIMEGKVEVVIDSKTYPIAKGNTLYFDSSFEHYFKNVGDNLAKILCVVTPVSL